MSGKEISKREDEDIWYPTTVTPDPANQGGVVVMDALKGRMLSVNQRLEIVSSFGSIGPAVHQFSRPYGVAKLGDHLVVADTHKQRIVELRGAELLSASAIDPWTPLGSRVDVYGKLGSPFCTEIRVSEHVEGAVQQAYDLNPNFQAFVGNPGSVSSTWVPEILRSCTGVGARGGFGRLINSQRPQRLCIGHGDSSSSRTTTLYSSLAHPRRPRSCSGGRKTGCFCGPKCPQTLRYGV